MKFLLLVMSFLGWSQLPDASDDGHQFTEEEKKKLQAVGYKTEEALANLQKDFNKELKAQNEIKGELEDARAQLKQLQQSAGLQEEEIIKNGPDRGGGANLEEGTQAPTAATPAANEPALAEQLKQVNAKIEALQAENAKLRTLDIPEMKGKKLAPGAKLQHSATHFMGSGKQFDAVENRPWNANAISGSMVAATNWNVQENVDTLVKDTEHFFRENPNAIMSLHRDSIGYPSFWRTRFNVSDMVAGAAIVTGEVTQARKPLYLPKGKQAIKTEDGKVFPVNIDLTYQGYYLQQMESSWLNSLYNDGTNPYKMSFVQFLLSEITKQARTEDRQAGINGVYSPVPESMAKEGRALERMDGLRIILWRAIHKDGKVKTINHYAPTFSNIVDHVEDTIKKNLKEETINEPNLVYYLPPSHARWYSKRYREIHGTETDFSGETMVIQEYKNIKLCPLRDLEGSNLHFITMMDNIEPMENRAGEKELYRFDSLKRDIFIYADYKTGIRFLHLGTKVKDTDPAAFKVQTVWTNGQPVFESSFNVTVYDDATGELKLPYNNVRVMDAWTTEITEISGGIPGQIVKITGSTTATGTAKVKHAANSINLAGNADFNLNSGGTLYLKVNSDNTYTEIKRTAAPSTNPEEDVEFAGTSINAVDGSNFKYVGTSAATLASILNPTEGRVITITQTTAGAGTALTITNVGDNIAVNSNAVLDAVDDSIELTVIDGVFTETNRNISA